MRQSIGSTPLPMLRRLAGALTACVLVSVALPNAMAAPAGGTALFLSHRVGFGASVTGGATAEPTLVTDCSDDADVPRPGTVRALLATPGPHRIQWATSCTIHLVAPLEVPSDTTLDGTGHEVTITGDGQGHDGLLLDSVSNVIIENLTVTGFGDPALRSRNNPYDGVRLTGASGVWVDHVTFSQTGDKQLAITRGSTDVTVSWSHFIGDPYTAQFMQIGNMDEGYALDKVQNVTSHHNFFDGLGSRAPAISYGTLHQYNDVVSGWKAFGVHCQRRAQCYLENTVYVRAATESKVAVKYDPGSDGCNDSRMLCDASWGAATVVGAYLPVTGTVAASSVKRPRCTEPVVTPCSWTYGSGRATFVPSYDYGAEPADAALRNRVTANAGAHVVPQW